MAEFKYEIKKEIGNIENGLKFRIIAWGANPEKYDIRTWYLSGGQEICRKGITFNKTEAEKLLAILENDDPIGTIPQGRNEIRIKESRTGYDIALWSNAYRFKGFVVSKVGIVILRDLLRKELKSPTVEKKATPIKTITAKKDPAPLKAPEKFEFSKLTEHEKTVHALTSIPVNDCNYPLNNATADELAEAIAIMEASPSGNKTRLVRCKAKLKSLEKKGANAKTVKFPAETSTEDAKPINEDVVEEDAAEIPEATKEEKEEKEEKSTKESKNIITFPKRDETVIKKLAPTGEHHKYSEVETKLNEERKLFNGDPDTDYVIDGILEHCVSDQEFLDNVMRPEKTYTGAMQYFANKAKEGYGTKITLNGGYAVMMTADTALKYAIDYFNSEEEKPTTKSSDKSTKKSASKTSTAKKSTTKKTAPKRKYTKKGNK